MMTIHKLTAGEGYTYLTRQVAGGDVQRQRGQDAADYYTGHGNPPGRWAGRGAELLGVAGQEVSEAQMKALFGVGMHPDADAMIAAYVDEHVRPDMTPQELAAAAKRAADAASLGSPFPAYQPAEPFASRVTARVSALQSAAGRPASAAEVRKIQAAEARRSRAAVAGFDVVFAPVKSAALVWALDERPGVRAAVRRAHEAARDAALRLLEEHAAFTRTGKAGIAQLATGGLAMAVFDHYDSRAGEPNLHTHVAVSSKVQGTDGIWRALDARPLYRMTVAASEFYNTRFEIELTTRLAAAGYRASFTARSGTARNAEPVREISGVPEPFIAFFSSRRAAIQARYAQLIRDYRTAHGHDPPRAVCHQLARRANLDTRGPKGEARSLNQMRDSWSATLTSAFGPGAVAQIMAAIPAPAASPERRERVPGIGTAARQAVEITSRTRSTWTAWNIRAEAERIIRYSGAAATPEAHDELAAAITALALSPGYSIAVTAPAPVTEPPSLRRPGPARESVFTGHGAARYTSAAILAAEQRLVTAATTPAPAVISPATAAASLQRFEQAAGVRLDPGQRNLVTAFAASGRTLTAGLGPAGSGKTTAMRAWAAVSAGADVRVIALAPSAAAAGVLSADTGLPADTLHKFLHEHTAGPDAARLAAGLPVTGPAAACTLNPGDLVLVDEAGLAGTLHLDQLLAIAARRGARVRLLGDYRQLSAPGCGGALRLVAAEAGAAELTTLYRFADPAEAAATLRLRTGDTAGLDFYAARDRIRAGSLQAMTDAAYAGWKADMTAGRTTLMTAATNADVTALSARARADRVAAGQVEPAGALLHDGNLAGSGDWILTRRNDRRLTTSGGLGWVKNGDAWQVTARHPDGSLTCQRLGSAGVIRLPARYVTADVELLYATTTYRAQGGTVDTAHPLITPGMSREHLYVDASRARHCTIFYVVTHELPGLDPDDNLDRVASDRRMYAAREVLTSVLGRETGEKSATHVIRDSLAESASLAELAPRFQHALETAVRPACKQIMRDVYGDDRAEKLSSTPRYPQLRRALLGADQAGLHPGRALARAASGTGQDCPDLPDSRLTEQLTEAVCEQLRQAIPRHQEARTMPAWLTIPASAASPASDDIPGYLRDLHDVMTARITGLTELAVATRPRWLQALGTPPAVPAAAAAWTTHAGVVAAWRDQHAITTSSADEVLGPRPEPGDASEPAWQHAAAAVAAARALSQPGQPPRHGQAAERPAADRNRALREARRAARRDRAKASRQQRRGQPNDHAPDRHPAAMRAEEAPRLLPPPPQHSRPISW